MPIVKQNVNDMSAEQLCRICRSSKGKTQTEK